MFVFLRLEVSMNDLMKKGKLIQVSREKQLFNAKNKNSTNWNNILQVALEELHYKSYITGVILHKVNITLHWMSISLKRKTSGKRIPCFQIYFTIVWIESSINLDKRNEGSVFDANHKEHYKFENAKRVEIRRKQNMPWWKRT